MRCTNLPLQLCHSLNGPLNRCLPIYSMAIIQIDSSNTQPLQTLLTRSLHVFRAGIDRTTSIFMNHIRKLCGQEYLVSFSSSFEPFTDEVFGVRINVRRIPVCLSKLVGTVEDLEALFVGLGAATDKS